MDNERTTIERWFFYQNSAALWKWARLDVLGEVRAHSGSSFDSRDACVEDARQNGYDAEHPAEAGLALRREHASRTAAFRADR